MSWLRERRVALAALTLFTLLAGDVWRYSITWFGWGAIIAGLLACWIVVAVRERVDVRRIPKPLAALLLLMVASVLWSAYPGASALGTLSTLVTAFGAIVMAKTISLSAMLRAFGVALRWVIGLSLVFELAVEVFVGRPILPLWVSYEEPFPRAYYWSRSLLFDGGRIQGIMGNANLLGLAALLAIIVFSIQLADRRVGRFAGIFWLVAAVAAFALSGSGTVIAMTIAVVAVLSVLLLARRLGTRGRLLLYGVFAAGTAAFTALVLALREPLLDLLGRSSDLTFRLDIWASVVDLIGERRVLGWGWVSYWAPWVAPFDDLAIYGGVRYLQAHSAWLDVAFQLGLVGAVVFAVLAVTTLLRCWSWAVDAPADPAAATPALRLLPALLIVALLVQSLAESRILVEAGWLLLVYLAVASRSHSGWFEASPGPARAGGSLDRARA
ncbi:O-antigen ligase family protein [Microcella flavibacter]|uniref:O-antigen ligase family protein n=1 Tax=Microcella flavibacter TaxID=1804990 RepID=UPI00145669F3|nr:O-antigen ligase family protein [Microcella flavibacter]